MTRDPFEFLEKPERQAHPPAGKVVTYGLASGLPVVKFTILGQPQSKANSRIPAKKKNEDGTMRQIWIKSKEALAYEANALKQIPPAARVMFEGPVRMRLRVWYASELPDLDESIILDVLQAKFDRVGGKRILTRRGVYLNDRQVRQRFVYHGIDYRHPRAEITVRALQPQQLPLEAHA